MNTEIKIYTQAVSWDIKDRSPNLFTNFHIIFHKLSHIFTFSHIFWFKIQNWIEKQSAKKNHMLPHYEIISSHYCFKSIILAVFITLLNFRSIVICDMFCSLFAIKIFLFLNYLNRVFIIKIEWMNKSYIIRGPHYFYLCGKPYYGCRTMRKKLVVFLAG